MLWIILCSHEWNMSSENNADCLSPAINCCLSIYLANGPLCSILPIHNNIHLYNIFHSFATDFTTNSRLYWTFKYYKIKYSATLSYLSLFLFLTIEIKFYSFTTRWHISKDLNRFDLDIIRQRLNWTLFEGNFPDNDLHWP